MMLSSASPTCSQVSPEHNYSIASSARAISEGGNREAKLLAVLRLIVSYLRQRVHTPRGSRSGTRSLSEFIRFAEWVHAGFEADLPSLLSQSAGSSTRHRTPSGANVRST